MSGIPSPDPAARPGPTARDVSGSTPVNPEFVILATHPETAAAIDADPWPLPTAGEREGYYAGRDFEYWLSGLYDCAIVRQRLPWVSWADAHVLDFGGATARVSRHLACQHDSDVVVCDVNDAHVAWVAAHLGGRVAARRQDMTPPLPAREGEFDVVLAFSVFTHIDTDEHAWLEDMRRVLRPGGTLYLTMHDEHSWRRLPGTPMLPVLEQSEAFRRLRAEQPELAGRVAFAYHDGPVYNCNVFHTSDYVRTTWGRRWDVVEIAAGAHGYQSAVVLRRPTD